MFLLYNSLSKAVRVLRVQVYVYMNFTFYHYKSRKKIYQLTLSNLLS